jgi:hypothetical protein
MGTRRTIPGRWQRASRPGHLDYVIMSSRQSVATRNLPPVGVAIWLVMFVSLDRIDFSLRSK